MIELYFHVLRIFAAFRYKAGNANRPVTVGPYITSLDMAGCSSRWMRADEELLLLAGTTVQHTALRMGC